MGNTHTQTHTLTHMRTYAHTSQEMDKMLLARSAITGDEQVHSVCKHIYERAHT